MRKIIAAEFITLDGVIQAPGGAKRGYRRRFRARRLDVSVLAR